MRNLNSKEGSIGPEVDDARRLENDPLDSWHSDNGAIDHADRSNDGGGDIWQSFDPSFFGITQNELSLVFMDDTDDLEGSQADHQESGLAALESLSNARQSSTKVPALERVSEDSFEDGAERNAFRLIRHHAQRLAGKKTSRIDRADSTKWLFGANEDDGQSISLELCCRVLDARADVIRLRLNYELWRNWMIFQSSFSFITVPVPEVIRGEIIYIGGNLGLQLCQEAWLKPGITAEEMVANVAGVSVDDLAKVPADMISKYRTAINNLEDRLLLSQQQNNWFLTGRNPTLLLERIANHKNYLVVRGSTMSWSRMFE